MSLLLGRFGSLPSGGKDFPATLSLTGWWRDYAGAPWNGAPSLGASGSRQLTLAGGAPTVGTPQNGHAPLVIAASSTDELVGPALSSVYSTTAYSGWAVFLSRNDGPNRVLFGCNGAWDVVNQFAPGPIVRHTHSGGTDSSGSLALIDDSYMLWRWRFSTAVGLELQTTGWGWTMPVAVGNALVPGAGNFRVGKISGSLFPVGKLQLLELGLVDTRLTDTDFTNIRDYCRARYALTGL